jgi:hypothetical protein
MAKNNAEKSGKILNYRFGVGKHLKKTVYFLDVAWFSGSKKVDIITDVGMG